MEDGYLCMLLLAFCIVAAVILTCVDLAIKSAVEPNAESIRDSNQARLKYLRTNRELIKLGVMQGRALLGVVASFTVFSYIFFDTLLFTRDYVFFSSFFVTHGWVLSTVLAIFIMTSIYTVFLNLLPTIIFHKFKKAIYGWLYYPTVCVVILSYPFSKLFLALRATLLDGEIGEGDKPISIEELSDAVEIVSKVNTMEEKRILTGMVRFANANVEDIMCHRTEMVTIDYTHTTAEVVELFRESGFSRIPVFKGTNDNITGIVRLKDILANMEDENYDWKTDIHDPLYANNNQPVNKLLLLFQSKKEHMAIVVDEYGSTLGLVTLEDVLEEIVGEIEDEFDEEEESCKEFSDGTYIIEGKATVSEFIDMLGMGEDALEDIPEEIDTVAGLVVELLRDFPKVGSTVMFDGAYNLTVLSMERHRIDRIRIEPVVEDE